MATWKRRPSDWFTGVPEINKMAALLLYAQSLMIWVGFY